MRKVVDNIEKFPILRIAEEGSEDTEDAVIRELLLAIILNNHELVTLPCSPTNVKYLAVGFLFSEGLLTSKDEIKKIVVDNRKGAVRVETETAVNFRDISFRRTTASGGGRGLRSDRIVAGVSRVKIKSPTKVSAGEVFALVEKFVRRSEVFKTTGGVHSAALCEAKRILIFLFPGLPRLTSG